MTDRYTIRARFPGAHGETITFAVDGATLAVAFDATGAGTVGGDPEVTPAEAAIVRTVDPTGAQYRVAPVAAEEATPAKPAKAATPKGK